MVREEKKAMVRLPKISLPYTPQCICPTIISSIFHIVMPHCADDLQSSVFKTKESSMTNDTPTIHIVKLAGSNP
jgi:hypothetical protein